MARTKYETDYYEDETDYYEKQTRYYERLKESLVNFYTQSIGKTFKRVNYSDQCLDILWDRYFSQSIFNKAIPELLPILIHTQLKLKLWRNPSLLNPSSDTEKGFLLTTLGRIVIYDVRDPLDREHVPQFSYEQGIMFLTEAMKLNYSDAYYAMGYLYECGLSGKLEPDYKKAKNYYEEAIALDNNPKALYRLARMHLEGKGFTKNLQEALELLERAKTFKHMNAILFLGDLYRTIDELPSERALHYYQEAAKANDGVGLRKLADTHFTGDLVEKNLNKACQLYRKAWLIDGDILSHRVLLDFQNKDDPYLKYHGFMGLAEIKQVHHLLESNSKLIWDCFVNDNLLSDKEKSEFTNQTFASVSPILEVERYFYRSLYVKDKTIGYWENNKYLWLTHKEKCMTDALKTLNEKVLMHTSLTIERSREIITKCSSRVNLLDCWINLIEKIKLTKPYCNSKEQQDMFTDLICKLECKRNSVLFENKMLFFSSPNEINRVSDIHQTIVNFAMVK